jgi:hypothetical protein
MIDGRSHAEHLAGRVENAERGGDVKMQEVEPGMEWIVE